MVTLKSTADGLTITLSDGPWAKVLAELALELERLREAKTTRVTRIRIETGERTLTPLEVEELAWLFELHDLQFEWGEDAAPSHLPGLEPSRALLNLDAPSHAPWEQAVLHPRTLRSGQVLRYAGHVVVVGDVNPGAEIIATGDVLVWGKLRGVVHAGAAGDDNAIVGALLLAPMQLRIGKYIARAPDERALDERVQVRTPEIARVRDGRIVIESWNFRE